jgi:hypothetical protein
MTMRADSSKRSRDSSMAMPKPSYSRRARPRPTPNSTRPPARWSSNEIFSATLSGSFQGRITAPVPSEMRRVLAAMWARNTVLSGQNA